MKVLLVEDNPVMQRMYGREFTEAGITVECANNGQQAIDLALSEQPDIILMDVMMPEMNGIEALKALKSNPLTSKMPIIMLSAYEDDNLLVGAMGAGANRYLVKSNFVPKKIKEIVEQVVAQSKTESN